MRILKVWTAVLVLAVIVAATGCGGSNMNPAAGKVDNKMMSDGNMMSSGKMATGDNMMDGKMSGDNKMAAEGK